MQSRHLISHLSLTEFKFPSRHIIIIVIMIIRVELQVITIQKIKKTVFNKIKWMFIMWIERKNQITSLVN